MSHRPWTRGRPHSAALHATHFPAATPSCRRSAPNRRRSIAYALKRKSPLLLLAAFRFAFGCDLPFRRFGGGGNCQPALGSAFCSPPRSVSVGLMDCLGHFADVACRFA